MAPLRLAPATSPGGGSLLESGLAVDGPLLPTRDFHAWFAQRRAAGRFETTRIAFADLDNWYFDKVSGDLKHRSGRFFSVAGVKINTDYGPAASWQQPMIFQMEIGILGILAKRFDGVLHCLMQAKMEPGNVNTVQLSPTVQATQSNYTRVHNGGSIPYLEYFAGARRGRVLVDTLQSEQGTWFFQKRNRNMVVETTEDVPAHEDFCWLTLGQIRRLLAIENLVNMPARTVLACIPFTGAVLAGGAGQDTGQDTGQDAGQDTGQDTGGFGAAVARTLARQDGADQDSTGQAGTGRSLPDVLSWLTEAKTRYRLSAQRVPLRQVRRWHRTADQIVRDDEQAFRVIAVSVDATTREVHRWTQPMLEPVGQGVNAFVAKRLGGIVHVLAHARLEPGYLDMIEVGPTVQHLPASPVPVPYLDEVLTAPRERVRFDVVQSEEGGRFYHATNRYLIVEAAPDFEPDPPPDYCWVAAGQLVQLLAHSRYLNIEARTLVACLNSLW